ncbi:MAG: hypothetical protein A2599_02255 [Candidatus Staskawiczbacteria bacterium RIFOXYD1_FULL_39_28]|uniref:Uncharacterized protein n=1 Tax=Candidatus Staskawiczbacteria bacterium RIFOXYC1_FULL_38_18 TaxID=1802229 RepID=A0A1G2JGA9_9BACT|nr:MAG: hypothetical protein A2401_03270 [Candidatus Staskawiczbacteria bacterium RIFOXYC1_FULL_38_18]OGZ91890.1 MAG: hypothetical protein A2599_02255 [Candidatus Staskawiczbacteria bacterium RIFOXYD1_FULL_39_28]
MKLPSWLFWLEWVQKTIWDPFWWAILFLIILWIPFLRVWWWVFLPIMLARQLKTLYIWWIDWDFDYAKAKWVVLEITPPREVLIPLKAMEDVFSVAWPLLDVGNFRERWCDGELINGPYWFSWEIASTEGKVHFYIRCLAGHKPTLEMALYAHYPDLEIKEVPDYTKLVPPTVPNDEWDMYGEDWDFRNKEDCYPIKTYEKFFEPQGERISAEEKRIDPIIGLLEGMSRLGPGEHYWVQFITVPVPEHDEPGIYKDAQKVVNKIAKRPEKKKTTIMQDVMSLLSQLIMGPKKEGSGDSAKYYWEEDEETGEKQISLTPGEREILTEVEKKMSKPLFRTTMRGVYVAKRENWKSPNRIIMRSYAAHFATSNLNILGFQGATRPRIHYFWRRRRVFLRARKMFRNAVLRFPPLFPKRMSDDLQPIFSTEEMATMWHFPLRVSGMVSPTMANVESKKAGPPPNLPVDE